MDDTTAEGLSVLPQGLRWMGRLGEYLRPSRVERLQAQLWPSPLFRCYVCKPYSHVVFALLLIKQGRLGEGAQQVAALGEQLLRHTLTFPISEGGFPHLLASKTKPCRRVSVKGTAGDINHALLREPLRRRGDGQQLGKLKHRVLCLVETLCKGFRRFKIGLHSCMVPLPSPKIQRQAAPASRLKQYKQKCSDS